MKTLCTTELIDTKILPRCPKKKKQCQSITSTIMTKKKKLKYQIVTT